MRRTTWLTSTCLALTTLAGTAGAQRADSQPRRRAPDPAPVLAGDSPATVTAATMYVRRPGEPEKGAFLGLNTSPAEPALQKQLQLKPGVGLVVNGVDPGSPAEQAGVKEFDILHKLDDQILVNQEQLAVLVRTYEPGREVALTVIREGKPQQLKAKLAERELPRLQLFFDHQDLPMAQYAVNFTRDRNTAVPLLTTRNARRIEGVGDVVEMRSPDGGVTFKASRITIEGERHKMTISSRGGRKHLRVEDLAGKVLFEGPAETKEELDKVPGDLRQAYTDILLDQAAGVRAPSLPPAPQPAPTAPQPELVLPPAEPKSE